MKRILGVLILLYSVIGRAQINEKSLECKGEHEFVYFNLHKNFRLGSLIYNYSNADVVCENNVLENLQKGKSFVCYGSWAYDNDDRKSNQTMASLAWVQVEKINDQIILHTQTNRVYGSKPKTLTCNLKESSNE